MPRTLRPFLLAACAAIGPSLSPSVARAQRVPEALGLSLGTSAIGVVTHAAPALFGRDYTEGYLTQPVLMARLRPWQGPLALRATIDFEGLTIKRGELTPGSYGEGYVDRRHPHTYAHELLAELTGGVGAVQASLSGGKGFAPFGTDDPMVRPIEKYPVNHHLAQVLERAVVIGAVKAGPVTAELGTFNGEEPISPSGWPNWSRFGDSWAGRLTVRPIADLEIEGSHAAVESPELRAGGGLNQRKWSTAARYSRGEAFDRHRYALVEWAATDELSAGQRARRLTSALAEGAVSVRAWEVGARLERTVRPEEERLLDPFHTVQPATDASVLGLTRWTVGAVNVSRPAGRAFGLRATPFVEVTRSHAAEVYRPSGFEPAPFYGSASQWGMNVGLRLDVGMRHGRMGRYGVADDMHDMHAMKGMHDMPGMKMD